MTREVVATIVSIFVAGIAWRGLETWRLSIVGKREHDAAWTVLRQALKVREEIRAVRVGGAVIQKSDADAATSEPRHYALRRLGEVFDQRMARLRVALVDLELAALDAEALWRTDARASIGSLVDCVHEVGAFVFEYFWLNGLYMPLEAVDRDPERVRVNYDLIWDRSSREKGPDAFAQRVENAVADVERFYRPKLALQGQARKSNRGA